MPYDPTFSLGAPERPDDASADGLETAETDAALDQGTLGLPKELRELNAALQDGVGYATTLNTLLSSPKTVMTDLGVVDSSSPTSCVAKIVASLMDLNIMLSATNKENRQFLDAMTDPVRKAGSEVSAVFGEWFGTAETPKDFPGGEEAFKALLRSISDPLLSLASGQATTAAESLKRVYSILWGSTEDGYLKYYGKTVVDVFEKMLWQNPEGTIWALYYQAFQHGVSAVDVQLGTMKQMKRLLFTVAETVSQQPAKTEFGMVNGAACELLCEAEGALRENAQILRDTARFDRKTFSYATTRVCSAKNLIYDGKFDSDFFKYHGLNFIGLAPGSGGNVQTTYPQGTDSAQQAINAFRSKDWRQIANLPEVRYTWTVESLKVLMTTFQAQHADIEDLYNNLKGIDNQLARLADIRLNSIMSLIVDMLRRQIGAVRRDLEYAGAGYSEFTRQQQVQGEQAAVYSAMLDARNAYVAAMVEVNAATTPNQRSLAEQKAASLEKAYADAKAAYDAVAVRAEQSYSVGEDGKQYNPVAYTTTQASAYAILYGTCLFMSKAPAAFNTIDSILAGQSKVIEMIRRLANGLSVAECGWDDPVKGRITIEGGALVAGSIRDYLAALDEHMARRTAKTQKVVQTRMRQALRDIRNHERFLVCLRSKLFFGFEELRVIGELIANAWQILKQFSEMAKNMRDIGRSLSLADMEKLLPGTSSDHDAFTALIRAIRCLLLQCHSPALHATLSQFLMTLQENKDKVSAKDFGMKGLDGIPHVAATAMSNDFIKQLQRIMDAVSGLMNTDLQSLCAPGTVTKNSKEPGTTEPEAYRDTFYTKFKTGPVGDFNAPDTSAMPEQSALA